MVGSEHLGRCIHALMLVEESTHVTSKRPVFGLAGDDQRSGSLFIGTAYLSPADRAGGDERRQLILAPRDGDGLVVGAAVGMGSLARPLGSERGARKSGVEGKGGIVRVDRGGGGWS